MSDTSPTLPPPLQMAEPETSAAVRERIVTALHADLVGPFLHGTPAAAHPESLREVLPIPPSRWYLTGFLASAEDRLHVADDDQPSELDAETSLELEDEEMGAGDPADVDDEGDPDPEPKRRAFFPSSIGMSLILPPAGTSGEAVDTLRVTVHWADYRREDVPKPDKDADAHSIDLGDVSAPESSGPTPGKYRWRRQADRYETLTLPLHRAEDEWPVPDSGGLRLQTFVQPSDAPGLEPGSRAVALFLVNGRPAAAPGRQDEAFAFQVGLKVIPSCGLVPRPDLRDARSTKWDARVADLQYRHVYEWAVGHGIAVESHALGANPRIRAVHTTWLPRATVRRVDHHRVPAVETRMEVLAELDSEAAVRQALEPLIDAYGAWIEAQLATEVGQGVPAKTRKRREETRDSLMEEAGRARDRIKSGIERIATESDVREAFCRANRAIAMASRKRNKARYEDGSVPEWRLFQLAFMLLNVDGIGDDDHADRRQLELIFFPTGGGKTEAYLGVIAFTLVLRRLRGRSRPDQGLGVAVILRYTLRLLTLDQLGRAATVICALELQRREAEKGAKGRNPLGDGRFSIGLWVGRTSTANTIGQVARDMTKLGAKKHHVFPLTDCPWCLEALKERSVDLLPDARKPREVVVSCAKWTCEFSARNSGGRGLPVLFVDEQIYRELPSFIIATVDKYAMTPWRGEVGMLFGRATARKGHEFFGALDDGIPPDAEALPAQLPPPELIVQDELHLISGPLGTMTGLYEAAIEHLTRYRGEDGQLRFPKIIASTATVRAAARHVKALFGREQVKIFPPQGIDANETFFSRVADDPVGRDYLGVAASGRRMKQVLLRTYVSLLAAAARWFDKKGGEGQPVDPYMTLVGYFNSLRELGGMRRLVEDEVTERCASYTRRAPQGFEAHNPHMGDRRLEMPVELTSRESTERVKQAKERLHKDRADKQGVDVLLASNMISVGVDIDRLGLMVMAGQPKTTAEYIQSTSRVGRDRKRPGLVVTCFNLYKARDRSHYEHFGTYHESFYRRVEAGSLTPFSGPALDRGLAGVMVGMFRHWQPQLAPPNMAMAVGKFRPTVGKEVIEAIVGRAKQAVQLGGHDAEEEMAETLRKRLEKLFDSWESIVQTAIQGAGERRYSTFDRGGSGKGLLFTALDLLAEEKPGADPRSTEERRFLAPTSMRDVEPSVHVYVDRRPPQGDG